MRTRRMLALALIALTPVAARAATWEVDSAHSVASFKVRHLMVSNVMGEFGKVTGSVSYDAADPTRSSVEATIETASVNTRHEGRDKHLKSADFFDVEKYPTITFKSKKVEKAGEGRLKVTGDLTIKGVIKEVVLDVEGPIAPVNAFGGVKSGASATTKINRQDFGVSWNKTLDAGGVAVGDEVTITVEVELNQKP